MAKPEKDASVSEMTVGKELTVHGAVVGCISPIKVSKTRSDVKYFDSVLTDGKKAVRLVSFEPRLRDQLTKAKEDGGGVAITNCTVQKRKGYACDDNDLEIIAGSKTTIVNSPKKFRIDDTLVLPAHATPDTITDISSLQQIPTIAVNQHLTIKAKVKSVQPIEKIMTRTGTLIDKQEVILADFDATCRCVLWDKYVETLTNDSSYKLSNVVVKSYNGNKYISLSEKSSIDSIDNLGDVLDPADTDDCNNIPDEAMIKGEIIGVNSCEEYISCKTCKGKVIKLNDYVGECTKCSTKWKLSKCSTCFAARFIIEEQENPSKHHSVSAYNDILIAITQDVDGNNFQDKLMNCSMMSFKINSKNVIIGISRD